MRYFEDFEQGTTYELGTVTVEHDEMVDFAQRFDPQPFHTDPAAAEGSVFGGLIASGWYTASAFMRLYVDGMLHDAASQGSPGVEELRWLQPVRPGDRLAGRVEIVEATPSQRNPTRGTLLTESTLTNQDGVVVLRLRARGLFGRRPGAQPEPA